MTSLAREYGGFTTPWRAAIDSRTGEDADTALVAELLRPEAVVLEAVADCGPKRNGGRAVLPAGVHAADLVISRRGLPAAAAGPALRQCRFLVKAVVG
jgi:hypothetical protein